MTTVRVIRADEVAASAPPYLRGVALSSNKKMNWLREAWAALPSRLTMLEPLPLSADDWSLLERLHTSFNDRAAHARLQPATGGPARRAPDGGQAFRLGSA